MKYLSLIWSFLLDAVKAFFGMDKPEIHEVKDAPAHPSTVANDPALIAELRGINRTPDTDGVRDSATGTSGEDRGESENSDAT